MEKNKKIAKTTRTKIQGGMRKEACPKCADKQFHSILKVTQKVNFSGMFVNSVGKILECRKCGFNKAMEDNE